MQEVGEVEEEWAGFRGRGLGEDRRRDISAVFVVVRRLVTESGDRMLGRWIPCRCDERLLDACKPRGGS